MNTEIHVILEILPNSFRMSKKILKEWKGVHTEVKVLQAFLPRRRTNPNKESSRKRNERTNSWAVIPL